MSTAARKARKRSGEAFVRQPKPFPIASRPHPTAASTSTQIAHALRTGRLLASLMSPWSSR